MSLARLYHRLLLLTGVLALGAYSTADRAPLLALLAIPAYTVGWSLSSRPQRRLLFPRGAVNAFLAAVIGSALLRSLQRVDVTVIAQLVVLILLIKFGDRRAPRDDAQILSLSVFLAIAGMLQSNSLFVGVQLIALLPLLIAVVMVFHLVSGQAARGEWPPAPAPRTAEPGLARSLIRAVRLTVAASSLAIVLAAGFVFVIMPRGVGENVLGNWGAPRQGGSTTGFTTHVKLGERGIISESPVVVMDFSVRDAGGHSLGGPDTVYYLRGAVMTDYRDGNWTLSSAGSTTSITNPGRGVDLSGVAGPQIRQTITMRMLPSVRGGWARLFCLYRPVRLELPFQTEYRYAPQDATLSVRYTSPGLTFSVWSVPADAHPDAPPARRDPREPGSDPISTLAVRILRDAGFDPDPARRPVLEDWPAARAIQDYLRREYAYTLEETPVPPGTDPVQHFLFTSGQGHCEYFASAMVMLCRAVGMNARMVTGYIAAEYNSASGAYLVRQSNAHAWAEVESGRDRWRKFDATSPADLMRLHRPAPTLLGRVRKMFDAVEFAWNSTVVGFDEKDREAILGAGELRPSGIGGFFDSLTSKLQRGGPRLFIGAVAMGVLVFAVVSILGFGISLASRLAQRVRDRLRARPPAHDLALAARLAQVGFYPDLLRLLESRGMGKPEWRPPLAHAASLPDARAAAAVRHLAGLYYRVRFGAGELSAAEREDAARVLAAFAGDAVGR
jgi:transglutaminase-like putative cysteine protease